MPADTIPSSPRIYPLLTIKKITDPNKLYAIPLLGILVKFIMLIPVYIYLVACGIATLVILVVNSFVVFFTGKYMPLAYSLATGVMRLNTKVDFFYSGLTNKYPGFSFDIKDNFSLEIPYPKNPNKWFAFPLIGGIARIIFLIPFSLYTGIVKNAVNVALVISWVPVLFKRYYPDTTFEMDRDYVRLSLSQWSYISGLSDTYPSFWISMNHKQRKILLLIAGFLLFLTNSGRNTTPPSKVSQPQNNMYPKTVTPVTSPTQIPNGY